MRILDRGGVDVRRQSTKAERQEKVQGGTCLALFRGGFRTDIGKTRSREGETGGLFVFGMGSGGFGMGKGGSGLGMGGRVRGRFRVEVLPTVGSAL